MSTFELTSRELELLAIPGLSDDDQAKLRVYLEEREHLSPALETWMANPVGRPPFVEFDREEDGRHIASIPSLPGVMVYGQTKAEAEVKIHALAVATLLAHHLSTIEGRAREEGYKAGMAEGRKNCVIDGEEVSQEELIRRLESMRGTPANAKQIAEMLGSYLNSQRCMLLLAKLTLYRAMGENPKVIVKGPGPGFRVSLERSNGEVEHFNRDGET